MIKPGFPKGLTESLEKIDIETGRELAITIREIPTPAEKKDSFWAGAGAWRDLINRVHCSSNASCGSS